MRALLAIGYLLVKQMDLQTDEEEVVDRSGIPSSLSSSACIGKPRSL